MFWNWKSIFSKKIMTEAIETKNIELKSSDSNEQRAKNIFLAAGFIYTETLHSMMPNVIKVLDLYDELDKQKENCSV